MARKKRAYKYEGKSPRENILWNSFGSFTYLFSTWLISVFVVRLSSSYEAAGILTLAMSIFGIFLPIAQYRTYIYQVSDTKHEYSAGEYFVFRVVTCLISLVLVVIYTVCIGQSTYLLPIVLFAIWRILSLLTDSCHATEQFYSRLDYAGISNFLQGVGSLLVFISVFFYSQSLSIAFAGMCLVVILVLLLYDLPKTNLLVKLQFHLTFQKFLRLFLRCLPIVLTGMIAAAAPNMPRQVINAFMGADELGAYGTLAAPVALIQVGANYVYNPLIGIFAKHYESGNRQGFASLFKKTVILMLVVGVACSLLLEWMGAPLLKLVYGESILNYLYLLQPLILGALSTAFMWFLNDLSQALRLFKTTAIGDVIAFVFSLLLMVPLIRACGLNGATFTVIIANLFSILFMLTVLFRRLKNHFITAVSGSKNAVSAEDGNGRIMNDMPLISILIPAYNAERLLPKALDSAIAQTYKNIEIIVIDDGSTDETSRVISDYAEKFPNIIKWQSQKNRGEGRTRNTLLTLASGEYITFLDADDWIHEDYLQTLFDGLGDANLVISGYELYDSSYCYKHKAIPNATSSFSKYEFCLSAGKLWRRSFIEENHMKFEPMSVGTDNLFNVRAYSKTDAIKVLPYAGYCIYSNSDSVTRKIIYDEQKSFLTVAQKLVKSIRSKKFLSDRLFQLFLLKSLLMDIILFKKSLSYQALLKISRRNLAWYKGFLKENDCRFHPYHIRGASIGLNLMINTYILATKVHLDWLLVEAVKYLPIKLPWE